MSRLRMLAVVLLALAGCDSGGDEPPGAEGTAPPSREARLSERLSGTVRIATPSVTQPFVSASAANFGDETPVEVEVSEVDSHAALARLCAGEVAMAAVDRPLGGELRRACRRNRVEPLRLELGWLAVAVVASSELGLECMSLGELQRVWRPGSMVERYEFYGAAPGTAPFDLFTRRVTGRAGAIRRGWTPFEDAAKIRQPLAGSRRALAFVNREVLHPLPEDVEAVGLGPRSAVPTVAAIPARRYPLTRPLYLYLARSALDELRVRSLAPVHRGELPSAHLDRPHHRSRRTGRR
ncbi:MAG: substrate-binding domain-containing protein [Thermoleophilaceae bacterium]|nr:substrate-binding domain-containing protein [Thermoleophilaceae bacterium]